MDENNLTKYQLGILNRLDEIINLLKLRNSIASARNEMLGFTVTEPCNCHLKGKTTGCFEACPVHG